MAAAFKDRCEAEVRARESVRFQPFPSDFLPISGHGHCFQQLKPSRFLSALLFFAGAGFVTDNMWGSRKFLHATEWLEIVIIVIVFIVVGQSMIWAVLAGVPLGSVHEQGLDITCCILYVYSLMASRNKVYRHVIILNKRNLIYSIYI